MQNVDIRQQLNKKNRQALTKLLLIALAIYVNQNYFDAENIGCRFRATLFNRDFLLYVIIPEVAMRMFFILLRTNRTQIEHRIILHFVIPAMLYTAWFVGTAMWYGDDFTLQCYEPVPSFGMFLYSIIFTLVFPACFIVICSFSAVLLFCPCITYSIYNAYM